MLTVITNIRSTKVLHNASLIMLHASCIQWWGTTFSGRRPSLDPCMLPTQLCGTFSFWMNPKTHLTWKNVKILLFEMHQLLTAVSAVLNIWLKFCNAVMGNGGVIYFIILCSIYTISSIKTVNVEIILSAKNKLNYKIISNICKISGCWLYPGDTYLKHCSSHTIFEIATKQAGAELD